VGDPDMITVSLIEGLLLAAWALGMAALVWWLRP
jgi:hypothetical protein